MHSPNTNNSIKRNNKRLTMLNPSIRNPCNSRKDINKMYNNKNSKLSLGVPRDAVRSS